MKQFHYFDLMQYGVPRIQKHYMLKGVHMIL